MTPKVPLRHRLRLFVAGLFIGEIREVREIAARAHRDLARERGANTDLLAQLNDAHHRRIHAERLLRGHELWLDTYRQIQDLPTTDPSKGDT